MPGLTLERPAVAAPVALGVPMSADEIAAEFFASRISRRTITARMPAAKRFYLGKQLHMWRADVLECLPILAGKAA